MGKKQAFDVNTTFWGALACSVQSYLIALNKSF